MFRSELLVFGEGKARGGRRSVKFWFASHQITCLIYGIQSEGLRHECEEHPRLLAGSLHWDKKLIKMYVEPWQQEEELLQTSNHSYSCYISKHNCPSANKAESAHWQEVPIHRTTPLSWQWSSQCCWFLFYTSPQGHEHCLNPSMGAYVTPGRGAKRDFAGQTAAM